jgi:hypothetical protein
VRGNGGKRQMGFSRGKRDAGGAHWRAQQRRIRRHSCRRERPCRGLFEATCAVRGGTLPAVGSRFVQPACGKDRGSELFFESSRPRTLHMRSRAPAGLADETVRARVAGSRARGVGQAPGGRGLSMNSAPTSCFHWPSTPAKCVRAYGHRPSGRPRSPREKIPRSVIRKQSPCAESSASAPRATSPRT